MDKIKDTMSNVGASLGLSKDSSKGGNDSHDKSHQSAGTEPRTSTMNTHPSTMGGSNMSGSGGMNVSGIPASSHSQNIAGSHGSSGPSCCQNGCKCGSDCSCGSNCSCASCGANNNFRNTNTTSDMSGGQRSMTGSGMSTGGSSSHASNTSTVNKALSDQLDAHNKVTSVGGSTTRSS